MKQRHLTPHRQKLVVLALAILLVAHPYLAHDPYLGGSVTDALERLGATAVVLSPLASPVAPRYEGIDRALASDSRTDVRIFGKPSARVNRRMGVVVGYEPHGSSLEALRERVCAAAAKVKVTE